MILIIIDFSLDFYNTFNQANNENNGGDHIWKSILILKLILIIDTEMVMYE